MTPLRGVTLAFVMLAFLSYLLWISERLPRARVLLALLAAISFVVAAWLAITNVPTAANPGRWY